MKQFAKSIALFLTVSLFIATVIAGDKRNDETRRSTAVKTATQKGALKDIPITVTKKTNITKTAKRTALGAVGEFVTKDEEQGEEAPIQKIVVEETEPNLQPMEQFIQPGNRIDRVTPRVNLPRSNTTLQKPEVYRHPVPANAPNPAISKQNALNDLINRYQNGQFLDYEEKMIIDDYFNSIPFQGQNTQQERSSGRTHLSMPNVAINEIMYNPAMPANADGTGNFDDYREFVEFHNTTDSAIDMSGWYFSEGVNDTFPSGTSIAANGYLVVGRDSAAYYAKYGAYPDVCCWDSGALSNSGEDIVLKNAAGATIDSVDYEDGNSATETNNGWLSSTDGTGPSLERTHPSQGNAVNSSGANVNVAWAAYTGTDSSGTPGAQNSTYSNPAPNLSESFDESTMPPDGWASPVGYWYRSTYYYNTAPGGSYVSGYGWLVSPKVSVSAGDTLRFMYAAESSFYPGGLRVRVSTTSQTDTSSFDSHILQLADISSTTYAEAEVGLDAYAGQQVYIAILRYEYTASYYYTRVDDITGPELYVDPSPVAAVSSSSLAFGEVNTSSTSSGSFTVSNSGGSGLVGTVASDNTAFTVGNSSLVVTSGGSQSVEVSFAPTTEAAYAGNIILTHNGASSPDTVAVSGSGTSSLLVEGFETSWSGTPSAPGGWTQQEVDAGNAWEQYSYYAHSGSYSARYRYTYPSAEHILVTPALDLSANPSGYKLTFWVRGYGNYSGTDLYVQIGTNDSTFTDTLAVYLGSSLSSTYTEQTIDLSAYTGTQYIGFRGVDAYGYYIYLDDVEVAANPPDPVVSLVYGGGERLAPGLVGDTLYADVNVGSNSGGGTLAISSVTSDNTDFTVHMSYPGIDSNTAVTGFTYAGQHGTSVYFFSDTAMTGVNALGHVISANGRTGHLVTISSAEENAYVASLITANTWIGFTDQDIEGTFTWVTGESADYTNWNSGEPNSLIGEDFVEIYTTGYWNDVGGSYSKQALFEFDDNTIHPGGSIDLHVHWSPSSFGMKKANVVLTHNAASSPDTFVVSAEAGRQYVNFDDSSMPFGWQNIDNDPESYYEGLYYNEGEGWSYYTSYPPGYGGAYARSHFNEAGSNDWMMTEWFKPVAGDSLIFYSNASTTLDDTLHVYLATSGPPNNSMDYFSTEIGEVLSQGYTNIRSAFDLSSYAGETIAAAIVHHGSVGTNYYSYRKVDDVFLPAVWRDSNAVADISTGELDFGEICVCNSTSQSITVTNQGLSGLTLSAATGNAAWTASVDTSSIASGQNATVTVTFSPSVHQDYTTSLVLTHNGSTSPDTVVLNGGGAPTAGGPDDGGYAWINSFDPNGPAFSWIDASGADTATTDGSHPIANGDDYRGTVALPFTFRFYSDNGIVQEYDHITVTTNGWIGMGPYTDYTSAYMTNGMIPSTSAPNNIIAPLWDDFKAGGSFHGTILTKTVGTAPNRQFAVIWHEIPRSSADTDYYTFEAVFDEATNNVIVQYLDVVGSSAGANNGVSATIGIENGDGTDGLSVSYNNFSVADSMAIKFVAPPKPDTYVWGIASDAITGERLSGVEVYLNGTLATTTSASDNNTLLDDPGFEDSSGVGSYLTTTSGWWVYPPELTNFYHSITGDGIYTSTDTLVCLEGDRCLKVWGQYSGVDNHTAVYQQFGAVDEGTVVSMDGWVMTHPDDHVSGENAFFLAVNWLDANFGWLGQAQSELLDSSMAGDVWHYVTVSGAAPAGVVYYQTQITYHQPSGGSGSVYVDDLGVTLTPGKYSYAGFPAGMHDIQFMAEGYNEAFFMVNLMEGDTLVRDVSMAPLDIIDMASIGFEAGGDLGSSDTSSGNYFAVVDTFVNADGDTVMPSDGSGMLVYPAGSDNLYNNNDVVQWVSDSSYDISGYGGVYMTLDVNHDTESNFDYFYVGLMLEDSTVHWETDDRIHGNSGGWVTLEIDLSWAVEMGATTVRPSITFDSDGSVNGTSGYWGAAFDNIAVEVNLFYLAPPGDLHATSYGSSIPLSWEEPASDGRASYNLQSYHIAEVDQLTRPMVMGAEGEMEEALKGPRQYETLTVDYDYTGSSTRSLAGYVVFRSEWPFGEQEMIAETVTNAYEDADVVDGKYYDYEVEAVYDEGFGFGRSRASARVGTPHVMLVDDFGIETFDEDGSMPEHWEMYTDSENGVHWMVGTAEDAVEAFYPSIDSLYYIENDSNQFAMIGDGRNDGDGPFKAILISPFLDFQDHESAVLTLDAFALMYTSSENTDYGSAKIRARADMGEWMDLVDVSYNHTEGWEKELVDVSWVAGWDKVQFAFGYSFGEYTTYYGNGFAIDNVDIHAVDGPTNLTTTADEESVTLYWEGVGGNRANEYLTLLTEEEKASSISAEIDMIDEIFSSRDDSVGGDITTAVELWIPESGDTTFMGSTVGFDNDYDAVCPYSGSTSPDVVYKLVLADSVNGMIIDLCQAQYDSKVYVYAESDLAEGDTTNIGCNDDYCSNEWTSYASYVELGHILYGGLSADTYYIVVDGYGGNSGEFTLSVSVMDPPAELMYNVYKDGSLMAEGLPDSVLTYTDHNVSLTEACYVVTASIMEEISDPGPNTQTSFDYIESNTSNEVCDAKVNIPPGDFALITPPDGQLITVDSTNLSGGQVFAWSESIDPNGSPINYRVVWEAVVDTGLFVVDVDTSSTSVVVPIEDIVNAMADYMSGTGNEWYISDWSWTVYADDGWDMVEASNGPRSITVDIGWYLNADKDGANIPDVFALHQNYPNPFNPVTTIRYDVPEQAHVTMEIYNILGQKVAMVVDGIHQPGFHAVRWNGVNMYGNPLSSGMYFYHIQAGNFRSVKKLILVK